MTTYLDDTDRRLVEAIPLPAVDTCRTGIDDSTLLIRFRTFYLKLTYDGANDGYRLEGYLFNASVPKLNLMVPRLYLGRFLGQLTEDNYLAGHFSIDWPIEHDRNRYH